MFLKTNMKKGVFITFEGIDGSGKSSLSKHVFDCLIEKTCKGVHTFEPTESFLGNSLREIILFSKEKLSPYQQVLLFIADRISHLEWIHQQLNVGQFVICDRYIYSTLAYQGIDEKIRQSIYTIHDLCLNDYYPDIVFLIDIDPVISLNRIQNSKKDNFEKVEFLKNVRSRYLDLANTNSKSFVILDGVLPLEVLTEMVLESLFQRFTFLDRGGKG
jgi:dTMP kinase